MLLFFVDLIVLITLLSLNGNVAQSVERKSHNLKVVSSILTVPTFLSFPDLCYLFDDLLLLLFYTVWAYGAMETHQTSDLRIAGSIPAMLVFFPFAFFPLLLSPYPLLCFFFLERERSSVGRA